MGAHKAFAILTVDRTSTTPRYSWTFEAEGGAEYADQDTCLLASRGASTYDEAFRRLTGMNHYRDFCFCPHEAIRITAAGRERIKERNASRKA